MRFVKIRGYTQIVNKLIFLAGVERAAPMLLIITTKWIWSIRSWLYGKRQKQSSLI